MIDTKGEGERQTLMGGGGKKAKPVMRGHGKQGEVLLRGRKNRGPEGNARQVMLEFVFLAASKKALMLDRLIEPV